MAEGDELGEAIRINEIFVVCSVNFLWVFVILKHVLDVISAKDRELALQYLLQNLHSGKLHS